MLFPKYFVNDDKFGVQNKVQFTMHYQNWKKKKPSVLVMPDVVIDTSEMGKNPTNFERRVEVFEKQPIKIYKIDHLFRR